MNFELVDSRLYRGPHPDNATALKNAGITCAIDLETPFDELPSANDDVLLEASIIPYHISIQDLIFPDWGRLDFIQEKIKDLQDAGQRIYLHCTHGVDRTGLVVCQYRIQVCKWTVRAAIQEWLDKGMHRFPYQFPLNWPNRVRKHFGG